MSQNQPTLPGMEDLPQSQPFTVNVSRYLELEIKAQSQAHLDKAIQEKQEFILQVLRWLLPVLLLLIIIAIGGASYWQFTSFKELQEKSTEAQKNVDEAKRNIGRSAEIMRQAEENLQKSKENLATADKNLDKSFQSVKDIIRATSDNAENVLNSQDNLLTAQNQIVAMQKKLRSDLQGQVNEAIAQRYQVQEINFSANETFTQLKLKTQEVESNLAGFNQRVNEIQQKANEIERHANLTQALAREVATTRYRVLNEEGDLQQVKAINKQLVNLKATQTVWLRQKRDSEPVRMFDTETEKEFVTFKFRVGDIEKDGVNIEYNFKRSNQENWKFIGWWPMKRIPYDSKKEMQNQSAINIPDTPYEIKVEYIARIRGDDFIVLTIRPKTVETSGN